MHSRLVAPGSSASLLFAHVVCAFRNNPTLFYLLHSTTMAFRAFPASRTLLPSQSGDQSAARISPSTGLGQSDPANVGQLGLSLLRQSSLGTGAGAQVRRHARARLQQQHQSLHAFSPPQRRTLAFELSQSLNVAPPMQRNDQSPPPPATSSPPHGSDCGEGTQQDDRDNQNVHDENDPDAANTEAELEDNSSRTFCMPLTPLKKTVITGRESSTIMTCVLQVGGEFDNEVPLIITDGQYRASARTTFQEVKPGDIICIIKSRFIDRADKSEIYFEEKDVSRVNEEDNFRGEDFRDLPRFDWRECVQDGDIQSAATVAARDTSLSTIPSTSSHGQSAWLDKQTAVHDAFDSVVAQGQVPEDAFQWVSEYMRNHGIDTTADFNESKRILQRLTPDVRRSIELVIPFAETTTTTLRYFIEASVGFDVARPDTGNIKMEQPREKLSRMGEFLKEGQLTAWTPTPVFDETKSFEEQTKMQRFANNLQQALLQTGTLLAGCRWSEIISRTCSKSVRKAIRTQHRLGDVDIEQGLRWLARAVKDERSMLHRVVPLENTWRLRASDENVATYLNRVQSQLAVVKGVEELCHRTVFGAIAEIKRHLHPSSGARELGFASGGLLAVAFDVAAKSMFEPTRAYFQLLWGQSPDMEYIQAVAALDLHQRRGVMLDRILESMLEAIRIDAEEAREREVANTQLEPAEPEEEQQPSPSTHEERNRNRPNRPTRKGKFKQKKPPPTTEKSSEPPTRSARASSGARFKSLDTVCVEPDEVTVGMAMAGLDANGRLDDSTNVVGFIGLLCGYHMDEERGQQQFHQLVCEEAEEVMTYAMETNAPEAEILQKKLGSANQKTWKRLKTFMICFHCGNQGSQKPHSWTSCDRLHEQKGQTNEGRRALEEFLGAGKETKYLETRRKLHAQLRLRNLSGGRNSQE